MPGMGGLPGNFPNNAGDSKLSMGADMRRIMEEEAIRIKEQQAQQNREREQRERERQRREVEERERRELAEYNASIPQKKVPMVQQEIGGYAAGPEQPRYNPVRAAPQAPGQPRQPPQGSLRQMQAQRPAPSAPNDASNPISPPRAPFAQNGSSSREQSPSSSLRTPRAEPQIRQPSPQSRPMEPGRDRTESPGSRSPPNGVPNAAPPTRIPGPSQPQVKPLNVSKTTNGQNQQQQKVDAIKQTEAALSKPAERQKEVRMSSMSESEVMAKLKKIVTRLDPNDSYVKQKKIGQGASGSVYVSKVRSDATSTVAKSLFRKDGSDTRVAVKTMDLRHQPRNELIGNEIIVMKESVHPNIVNYLDSFLVENDNELWVIMEFMNGGALTDVIENNPLITEDQIAAICNEVG